MDADTPRESASVGVRLQQAWKRFRDDPRGRVAFRRESQVLQDSRAALRVYADGLFLAPYLVATHQRWAWRGVDDDVVADRAALQSWLEGLYRLGTQLSQLEGRPLEAVAGRQLQGLVEQTRQAQRQLLERLPARSVRAASLAVKETGPDEVTAPIVDCLATPLMAADVRHRLRERLRNQPAPLANAPANATADGAVAKACRRAGGIIMSASSSALVPADKARLADSLLDVVADGSFIDRGRLVRVVERQGSRIVVAEIT